MAGTQWGKKKWEIVEKMVSLKQLGKLEKDVKHVETNIVFYWLKYLDLESHFDNFLDHGYDELETIKCIGEEDLKAIGVNLKNEQSALLEAVEFIRHRGAAWVYFLPHAIDNHIYEAHENMHSDQCLDTNEKTNSDSSGVESWESSEDRLSVHENLRAHNFSQILVQAEITPTHNYKKNTKVMEHGSYFSNPNNKTIAIHSADSIETCVSSHYEKFQADRNLLGFIKNVLGCAREPEEHKVYYKGLNISDK